MVKKLKPISVEEKVGAQRAGTARDSTQQIWLAGLGAFSRAREEGGKVFEGLVREGLSIQRKTQAVAEETITEATSRVASMANDISSKASGQWDKLEGIFEDRVARALAKLGVPSAKDIDVLMARIDDLNRSVQALSNPAPAATARRARSSAAKKAASAAPAATPVAEKPTRKRPARKTA
jgi:poly(hydroxyalkanoate) granule-associated protein